MSHREPKKAKKATEDYAKHSKPETIENDEIKKSKKKGSITGNE